MIEHQSNAENPRIMYRAQADEKKTEDAVTSIVNIATDKAQQFASDIATEKDFGTIRAGGATIANITTGTRSNP